MKESDKKMMERVRKQDDIDMEKEKGFYDPRPICTDILTDYFPQAPANSTNLNKSPQGD